MVHNDRPGAQNPPDQTQFHKRYNELLSRARVAAAAPLIAALAAQHVESFVARGGGEFMAEVAAKPMLILAKKDRPMLSLETRDRSMPNL